MSPPICMATGCLVDTLLAPPVTLSTFWLFSDHPYDHRIQTLDSIVPRKRSVGCPWVYFARQTCVSKLVSRFRNSSGTMAISKHSLISTQGPFRNKFRMTRYDSWNFITFRLSLFLCKLVYHQKCQHPDTRYRIYICMSWEDLYIHHAYHNYFLIIVQNCFALRFSTQ